MNTAPHISKQRSAAAYVSGRVCVAQHLNFGSVFCITVRPEFVPPAGVTSISQLLSLPKYEAKYQFGYTGLLLSTEEQNPRSADVILKKITVLMAGCAAQRFLNCPGGAPAEQHTDIQAANALAAFLVSNIPGYRCSASEIVEHCHNQALGLLKAHSALVTKVASELLKEETLLSDRFLEICSESGMPVAIDAAFTPSQAAAPVTSTMVGRKLLMPVCDPERFIAGAIELVGARGDLLVVREVPVLHYAAQLAAQTASPAEVLLCQDSMIAGYATGPLGAQMSGVASAVVVEVEADAIFVDSAHDAWLGKVVTYGEISCVSLLQPVQAAPHNWRELATRELPVLL